MRTRQETVFEGRTDFDAVWAVEADANVGSAVSFGAILTGVLVDDRTRDAKDLIDGMAGVGARAAAACADLFLGDLFGLLRVFGLFRFLGRSLLF
jgi:hypothetical protein